ncbi:hypothetical protein LIER_27851 [Lithospermum erythrorhizon]|uniref:Anoctamin n=1 Tax=Lithospermum erythrorhizon TaxID=34254 RepID=A0AAV3RGG9_LITER
MIPQDSVNIEAHAAIRTPALESLHRRSAMEEAPEDFVGSLLRDSPEALPTTTSRGLDDTHGPLNVQPLRSRMRPPVPRTVAPKPSKGKSTKEPPTLEEVKAKTIPELITNYQLRQICNYYEVPDEVKTRIPLGGESVDAPSTKTEAPKEGEPEGTTVSTFRVTSLFWEFFNYGLRFPMLGFVEEVLITLDRALGQLIPFAWLVLAVFQVACLSVGVVPNIVLFNVMYNVLHKVLEINEN